MIAFERSDRRIVSLLQSVEDLHVPAGVVAQVRLDRLLASEEVALHTLDGPAAWEAGRRCGLAGTADVIDA